MTTITERSAADGSVEAAIARVLEAERAARLAIAGAESDAAAAVEAARAIARAIALRTEARIRAVRAAFERRTTREVAALDATAAEAARPHPIDADDEARLAAAVRTLAARLTGGGSAAEPPPRPQGRPKGAAAPENPEDGFLGASDTGAQPPGGSGAKRRSGGDA